MLESDLRELFERQAATELPPAPISIPAARRSGRTRLLRRRLVGFGSPVLAAATVVAVLLAGAFAVGPRQPAQTPGGPAAPKLFNPLVPYAATTWYPYRPDLEGSSDWHTALLLRASSRSPAESTEVVLYPAGWCTLKSASLSCGSTAAGTRVAMSVTGRAPGVQGQAAYWTRYNGGNLTPMQPRASGNRMVAFQYARGGWAVVESTSSPADVIKIAASLRYGQTAPLRFAFRLTGLPQAWREVLFAGFTHAVPRTHGPAQNVLVLGSPATRPGTTPRGTLFIQASTRTAKPPHCRTVVSGQGHSRPETCPSTMINGYRAYPGNPRPPASHALFVPDADGLYLYAQTTGSHPPLSLTTVFAHHLQLLGPDAADWTPAPGGTVHLDQP